MSLHKLYRITCDTPNCQADIEVNQDETPVVGVSTIVNTGWDVTFFPTRWYCPIHAENLG